jgi:hypothetical protein
MFHNHLTQKKSKTTTNYKPQTQQKTRLHPCLRFSESVSSASHSTQTPQHKPQTTNHKHNKKPAFIRAFALANPPHPRPIQHKHLNTTKNPPSSVSSL